MALVVRLQLLACASTGALADAHFPADEPLSERGLREVQRIAVPVVDHVATAPEQRAVATATTLGMNAEPEDSLRELDYGTWAGRSMTQVPEPDLAVWLTDPRAAPHGGESVADLIERTRQWLEVMSGRSGRWLAVTHPSVIRAATLCALGAPASAFWRIDVPPVSITRLNAREGRWTLRLG